MKIIADDRKGLQLFGGVCILLYAISPLHGAVVYSAKLLYPITAPDGLSFGSVERTASGGVAVGEGGFTAASVFQYHAIWWTASGVAVDLNPTALPGIDSSRALAGGGSKQVGYGYGSGGAANAMVWSGSASSAVNLNPEGFVDSFSEGTNGVQEAGWGYGPQTGGQDHAILWSGTAASAVDLHPVALGGFSNSIDFGIGGSHEVGWGNKGDVSDSHAHALMWEGTADSAVDLNPTDLPTITDSVAEGAGGGEEVGYGYGSGAARNFHAIVWHGSGDSAVDLNPTNLDGFVDSEAFATNGMEEVGYGDEIVDPLTGRSEQHALAWFGSADSAIDLHALLPTDGEWFQSTASSIDDSGNVFGVATGTVNGVTGDFVVEWSAAPEPGSLGVVAAGGIGVLLRRRRI